MDSDCINTARAQGRGDNLQLDNLPLDNLLLNKLRNKGERRLSLSDETAMRHELLPGLLLASISYCSGRWNSLLRKL